MLKTICKGRYLSSPLRPRLQYGPGECALAVVLAAFFVICSVISLRGLPFISFDASYGLLIWRSMARGAAFNYQRMPWPQDLARDFDFFWAAHSPGQFYLPGVLSHLLGIQIYAALRILQILGVALGIVGYYLLYIRTFSFTKKVALVACLVSLLRTETLNQFVEYSGGALLLFAGTPYVIRFAWACFERRGFYLALVPLIFLAGAFLKLSFLLVALSVTGASLLVRVLKRTEYNRRQFISRSATDILLFGLFYGLVDFLHTSRGWTASHLALGRSVDEVGFVVCYSFAAILSGATSIFTSLIHLGSPLYALCPTCDAAHFDPNIYHPVSLFWIGLLVALGVAFLVAFRWIWLKVNQLNYRALLFSFVAVHFVVMTGLFLGGTVPAEDRHFWPVSALLLPGLISAILGIRSALWRWALSVVIAAQLCSGLVQGKANLDRKARTGRPSHIAIAYPDLSQDLINTIERLDADSTPGRSVFVVTQPFLALLVQNTPSVVSFPLEKSYSGTDKLSRLIVVVPDSLVKERTLADVESVFGSKRKWQSASYGRYWVLCVGCSGLEDALPSPQLSTD